MDVKLRSYGKLRLSGTLTMGTYNSIAVYFVPRFFKFIRQRQDDLSMNLVSAPSRDLLIALKAGDLDFIVSIDPPKAQAFSRSRFCKILIPSTAKRVLKIHSRKVFYLRYLVQPTAAANHSWSI